MLIPVYLRGSTYYLHIRIAGKQFKRSLNTSEKTKAIIRASKILEMLSMAIDWSKIKKYEIDLQRGVFKAQGTEDHKMMVEAIGLLNKSGGLAHKPSAPHSTAPAPAPTGLTLLQLLGKYLLLKKSKPASVLAYKNTVAEFEAFTQTKCYLSNTFTSDITSYQEHLAKKGNTPRTIDNKVAYLKTLFNFAIKQGYLQEVNPVSVGPLQSKADKAKGYAIFELPEIQKLFSSDYFNSQKTEDPDYYYVLLLALMTGCRIGELTSLKKDQFQITTNNNHIVVIRGAKTPAGSREIPLPSILFVEGFQDFLDQKTDQVFKYQTRSGRGSGNAVGKKFSRQMVDCGVTRDKLVFHSIRKFVNDNYQKNGVAYEPRCQVMGHTIDNVNVEIYTNKYSAAQLSGMINPIQFALLLTIKLQK